MTPMKQSILKAQLKQNVPSSVGSEGLPKIKLEQIVRYSSSKANVGLGSRGIDGNTKPMWSAANDNFTQFFDGTYNATAL